MLKRVLDYCSNKQRLNIATVGAILSHLLLFGGGFLVIDQFLIPSDTNRILILSLEMETEDGEQAADFAQAHTINTSKLGEASSIIDQTTPTEMAAAPSYQQLEAQTGSLIESLIEPEAEQPSPARDSTLQEFSEVSMPPNILQSTSDKTQSLPTPIPSVAFDNAAIVADESMLSVSESSLIVATKVSSALTEDLGERLELSNTQQKMLNRKIRHWTENMEDFSESSEPISWRHKGQTYVANFNRLPAAGDMDMDEVVVEIITEQHGKELKKELRMKKLAFSNFAQFTHLWDDNVSIHDDILEGRFHSNSTIYVASDRHAAPIFNGKVTTASYQVEIDAIGSRRSKKNIFLGGLQTRVKKILMPRPNLLFNNKFNDLPNHKMNDAVEGTADNTLVLNEDTRIYFHRDGSLSWQAMDASDTVNQVGAKNQSRWIGDEPFYILAGSSVKLSASGTINGKVLLYSPKRVTIEGNLVYANRGDIATGGDFLGIVSGRDVVIAASTITGPGDLRIDASIYAKGQFKVKNYRSPERATLHLFGSVSAMSMGATEPRYATNIVFDQRLENTRPPGFPVTNRYELAAADQDWKDDGWLENQLQESPVEPNSSFNQ